MLCHVDSLFNSLWFIDTFWRRCSQSPSAQIMTLVSFYENAFENVLRKRVVISLWPQSIQLRINERREHFGNLEVSSCFVGSFLIILLTDAANFRFNFNMECHPPNKSVIPMMTSSNGNIFRVTGFCERSIPLTKANDAELLMYSLICGWPNGWANNRDACDLIRHHAHYDVTVMRPWLVSIH